MSYQPKVSIVIPVYNAANFMRQAIDSALAQTYPNTELLVVNDGSSDDGATHRIALSYGDRIKYFVKDNGGVASALNFAIDKMTGDYFTWLSHDDLYRPHKVQKQLESIIDDLDHHTVSVCNVTVIDGQGKTTASLILSPRVQRSLRCFLAIDTATGINGCALLIPKALFDRAGRFNAQLKTTQDYDLWFRFSYHARFVYVPDELVLTRSHASQASKTMGALPTLEADQLHATMLSSLELPELAAFVGGDLAYLEDSQRTYKRACYRKTAARLFALLVKLHLQKMELSKAAELLQGEVGAPGSASKIKLQQLLDWLSRQRRGSRKPLVMVYCNVWARGGMERVLAVLLEELQDKFTFVLVSSDPSASVPGYALPDGVHRVEVRTSVESDLSYVLLTLAGLTDAAVVIGNPNIIAEMLAVYPVLRGCGIKTIAFNHYNYFLPTRAPWLYPILANRLALLRDATVATWPTAFSANVYALSNSNAALMPNPNTFETRSVDSLAREPASVLCIGRFCDAVKRLDRMLKVFRLVIARIPEARLYLVGGHDARQRIPWNSRETIGDLIARLKFPDGSVRFEGEREDVSSYYERASVLMMTSDSEGFGLVLNEAGAYGVPSVSFEISGLDDLVSDGKNGFICPQDDLECMAERIIALMANGELWQSMSRNAVEMAKRFDRKRLSRRWSELVEVVVASKDDRSLEGQLARDFMSPPNDPMAFGRAVAKEYEKGISAVVDGRGGGTAG